MRCGLVPARDCGPRRPGKGRRIAVLAEYLNSYAAVYLDGKKLGEMYFPVG